MTSGKEKVKFWENEDGDKCLVLDGKIEATASELAGCICFPWWIPNIIIIGCFLSLTQTSCIPMHFHLLLMVQMSAITTGVVILGAMTGIQTLRFGANETTTIMYIVFGIPMLIAVIFMINIVRSFNKDRRMNKIPPHKIIKINHKERRLEVIQSNIVWGLYSYSIDTAVIATQELPGNIPDEFVRMREKSYSGSGTDIDVFLYAGDTEVNVEKLYGRKQDIRGKYVTPFIKEALEDMIRIDAEKLI